MTKAKTPLDGLTLFGFHPDIIRRYPEESVLRGLVQDFREADAVGEGASLFRKIPERELVYINIEKLARRADVIESASVDGCAPNSTHKTSA